MSEPLGRSLHAASVRPDAEAEPMLRQGYEGIRSREVDRVDRPARLAEAVDRLIELYTARNKLEEVKRWRAERSRSVEDPGSKPIEEKWRTPTRLPDRSRRCRHRGHRRTSRGAFHPVIVVRKPTVEVIV